MERDKNVETFVCNWKDDLLHCILSIIIQRQVEVILRYYSPTTSSLCHKTPSSAVSHQPKFSPSRRAPYICIMGLHSTGIFGLACLKIARWHSSSEVESIRQAWTFFTKISQSSWTWDCSSRNISTHWHKLLKLKPYIHTYTHTYIHIYIHTLHSMDPKFVKNDRRMWNKSYKYKTYKHICIRTHVYTAQLKLSHKNKNIEYTEASYKAFRCFRLRHTHQDFPLVLLAQIFK
jgi:hypothetical protein